MDTTILTQLQQAKKASFSALTITTKQKNEALTQLANLLEEQQAIIFEANQFDISNAKNSGKDSAFVDRLTLNPTRYATMIEGIHTIITLPDPVGERYDESTLPNGLKLWKMRVPIGVILVVYEARPNVTIDVAGLALKSGNVCLAKGGSSSSQTNLALAKLVHKVLQQAGISEDFFQYLELQRHDDLYEVLKADQYIDLVIPRGGENLVRSVAEHSRIPVIMHDKGIDQIYIDQEADMDTAWKVCLNAKINRPSTCNAVDVLLVHEAIADSFLPTMIKQFLEKGVEVRGDEKTRSYNEQVILATEKDWGYEFLDFVVAIKVVKNLDEATSYINTYGSRHTEAIMTENKPVAEEFIKKIDAGVVFVNASTRLNDGFEFGLGAELGVSTGKLHARGPMALKEMTTYKWIGWGSGQIREK